MHKGVEPGMEKHQSMTLGKVGLCSRCTGTQADVLALHMWDKAMEGWPFLLSDNWWLLAAEQLEHQGTRVLRRECRALRNSLTLPTTSV